MKTHINMFKEREISLYFALNMKRFQLFFLISTLVCVTLAEPSKTLFKSTKNNEYFVQPSNEYTWAESSELCKNMNMELLTIETLEKSEEIKEMLNKIFTGKKVPRFYIGANDLKEFRKFTWTSTVATAFDYTDWEATEPNNYQNLNERCVHIGFHGTTQWNDVNCSRKYGYICQKVDYDKLINLGPRV